jgi:minor extracellular serine protease Vpr
VRRFRSAIAIAAIAVLVAVAPAGAASRASRPTSDSLASRSTVDKAYALVQLKGAPLSTYSKTKPAAGKKVDFSSATTKNYRALLSAQRNTFKKWLLANAPKARVTGSWDISLNAVSVKLNGTTLTKLRSSTLVVRAEYEGLYYPTADDPDLGIIDAIAAWSANGKGGAADAGKGVRVAIVDTGIDQDHACFDDAGYTAPAGFPRGQIKYTNNKVIVAKVFNNKGNLNGFDAKAVQDHGTHVAGTVACDFQTPAVVDGVSIPYGVSGVAPAAFLGNYNVFPGDVLNARSEDILNALDAAYSDGFDVANMSLGGGAHGIQDLLTIAVDNLDAANFVIAVAAGNSGPGHFTVESPGSAARALSAGASTVPHFVGAPLTVGGSTYGIAAGDFATVSADLTATLGVVLNGGGTLSNACTAGAPGADGKPAAGSLTGKIALISRGVCTFSEKIRNAQDAGAAAAVVVNNVAGDPTAMGLGGIANEPTIPAYMAALTARAALVADNGLSATIGAAKAYFSTTNVDIMAGFSSQGPTDVDFRVKPDVVAPGVNVLSSIPGNEWAFFQGTSMATPHLAGSAAVVKSQHPSWPAWAIRSAIVNTAETGVLKAYTNGTTIVTDVNVEGAGRVNLDNAVNATAALSPVSVSFGAIPSGAGQTKTFPLTILNTTGSTVTWTVAIAGTTGNGVSFSVGSPTITLAAGASGSVNVTMTATKAAAAGDNQAWLTVSNGATVIAHAAVYTLVK